MKKIDTRKSELSISLIFTDWIRARLIIFFGKLLFSTCILYIHTLYIFTIRKFLSKDHRLLNFRSITFERGRISGRFESRSINSFEATNVNQAHLSFGERNVSRGR